MSGRSTRTYRLNRVPTRARSVADTSQQTRWKQYARTVDSCLNPNRSTMVPSGGPSSTTKRIRSEPVRLSRRPVTIAGSRPKSDTRPTAAGIRSRGQSGANSGGSGASTTAAAGAQRPNRISATASRRCDALQAVLTFQRVSAIRPVRSSEAQVTRTSFRAGEGPVNSEIQALGEPPRVREVEFAEGGPAFEQEVVAEGGRIDAVQHPRVDVVLLGVVGPDAEFPGSLANGCFVEHQLRQLFIGNIHV